MVKSPLLAITALTLGMFGLFTDAQQQHASTMFIYNGNHNYDRELAAKETEDPLPPPTTSPSPTLSIKTSAKPETQSPVPLEESVEEETTTQKKPKQVKPTSIHSMNPQEGYLAELVQKQLASAAQSNGMVPDPSMVMSPPPAGFYPFMFGNPEMGGDLNSRFVHPRQTHALYGQGLLGPSPMAAMWGNPYDQSPFYMYRQPYMGMPQGMGQAASALQQNLAASQASMGGLGTGSGTGPATGFMPLQPIQQQQPPSQSQSSSAAGSPTANSWGYQSAPRQFGGMGMGMGMMPYGGYQPRGPPMSLGMAPDSAASYMRPQSNLFVGNAGQVVPVYREPPRSQTDASSDQQQNQQQAGGSGYGPPPGYGGPPSPYAHLSQSPYGGTLEDPGMGGFGSPFYQAAPEQGLFWKK